MIFVDATEEIKIKTEVENEKDPAEELAKNIDNASYSELESVDEIVEKLQPSEPLKNDNQKLSVYKEFNKIQNEAQDLLKDSCYGRGKRTPVPSKKLQEINKLNSEYNLSKPIPSCDEKLKLCYGNKQLTEN